MKSSTKKGAQLSHSVSSRPKSNLKSIEYSVARWGRLVIGLRRTSDKIAGTALCSKVLRRQGAVEAEENLTAKWNKCNIILI